MSPRLVTRVCTRLAAARRCWLLAALAAVPLSCVDGEPPPTGRLEPTRLRTDRTYLRDAHGRYIQIHGVNASCTTKVPVSVSPAGLPTYVGRPFPLSRARQELARMRDAGFNAIRLLVMWEGVEPVKKGQYDEAYLDYIRAIVQLAAEYDIYVLLDMHQDMFSRHLMVKYNPEPELGQRGSLEYQLLALTRHISRGYTAAVQGDGAPRWAVQACLYEKKMDSKYWGTPRILSGLGGAELDKLVKLYEKLTGAPSGAQPPDWAVYFALALPGKFPADETTDMLPFTNWGLAHALSVDVARCYACLLAGNEAYPDLKVEGQNIEDYLQEAYAGAWTQVALRVRDLPNVLGYDIINEPGGNFITLSAVAAMIKSGAAEGAKALLESLLGPRTGADLYDTLVNLRVLPPDTTPETLRLWGLDKLDLFGALGLNNGFDDNHLRPFYERVGAAILKVDPRALLFIESSSNIALLTGGMGGIGGMWEQPMKHPSGLEGKVVYAPHWYPDIYPYPGFNVDPRRFTAEQVRYRDYRPQLEQARALASYSLGHVPVVFGEFGSYFNFNNHYTGGAKNPTHVDVSRKQGYRVTSHILDNYYEAFEGMFQSRILWCYSTENDPRRGDLWNHEDFSVLGPDGELRSQEAWSRPHARALAGKPLATHFYSRLHYFDPDKGVRVPEREFLVRYGSRETRAPTEIVVPRSQYPDGFYVWVSDGLCHWDPDRSILYHHPASDEPGVEHWVRLRPPLEGKTNTGWRYFFRGGQKVGGR